MSLLGDLGHGGLPQVEVDGGGVVAGVEPVADRCVHRRGKLVSIYPDNLKNLDWIFRKRLAEVTGKELPRTRDTSQAQNDIGDQSNPVCPVCGGKMVMRRARHGANAGKKFWGCSQWAKTKYRGIINV